MLVQFFKLLVLLYVVKRVFAFIKGWRSYSRNVPKIITPIQPLSLWSAFLPSTPFHRRLGDHWDRRLTLYEDNPLDTVVIQPWLNGPTYMWSRNLASFVSSLSLGCDFVKAPNKVLEMFGDNVVSLEGEMWKRHRRIAAPAFNHTTYKNVWDTTLRVYQEMIAAEGWTDVSETPVTNFSKITHKLALFLITIVGFGLPMTWVEPPRTQNGKVSTQAMIFDMATYIMERWFSPRWLYWFGIEKLKQIDEAYTAFVPFMKERIAEREAELKKLKATDGQTEAERADLIKDIFGRLVLARLADGKLSLSDDEIIGNSFVFTFAGHETSANTLSAVFGLLALYPDEQEWVYQTILEQLGDREPSFDDFDGLTGVMACFLEGLRLYPAGYLLDRIAAKDTVLMLPRRDNPSVKEPVHIKEGSTLILDMVGMCYDPNNFPDPMTFNPRRFTSSKKATTVATNKATQADEVSGNLPVSTFEGFLGFSYGPRTCIGHKFAKVESVAFITMVLREWKVVVDLKGETTEQWRARVLAPEFGQALLIGEVPLKLVRRK